MSTNQSIHPRVLAGTPKVNTSRPPSKDKARRVAEAIEAHLINHPHDAMSQTRLAGLKAKAGI